MFDEKTRTTVTVRGKALTLKREWMSGLWSWVVHDGDKKLGWVLQQSEGKKWACVPVEADLYDDIWYEYDSRLDALYSLHVNS